MLSIKKLQPIMVDELQQPVETFGQWQVMLNGDVVCSDYGYCVERIQLDTVGELNAWYSWLNDKRWFIKSDFDKACEYARNMPRDIVFSVVGGNRYE